MTPLAPPPDLGASEALPSTAGGKQLDRTFRAEFFFKGCEWPIIGALNNSVEWTWLRSGSRPRRRRNLSGCDSATKQNDEDQNRNRAHPA